MSTGQSIAESVNLALAPLTANCNHEFERYMQRCEEGLGRAGGSKLAKGVRKRMRLKKEVLAAVSDKMAANGVVL